MGWTTERSEVGVRVPVLSRIFSASSRPAMGLSQLPTQFLQGLFSREKRLGREADHSLPASAEVKKMSISTYAPPLLHSIVIN
jgi:hypothetical protein